MKSKLLERRKSLELLLLMWSLMIACTASSTWKWVNPLPQNNHLYAVCAAGPEDIYLVGAKGTIVHWDGTKWTEAVHLGEHSLTAVWADSPSDIFITDEIGSIFRGSAENWIRMQSPADQPLYCIWGLSDSELYAGGDSGLLMLWDGNQWNEIETGIDESIRGIWGVDSLSIVFVTAAGTIYRRTGSLWTSEFTDSDIELTTIWGFSSGEVYAGGSNGTILQLDGSVWTRMETGTDLRISCIRGLDAGRIYAVAGGFDTADDGLILQLASEGWQTVLDLPESALWGLDVSSQEYVFAGGSYGTMRKWDGYDWKNEQIGSTNALFDIYGFTGSEVFVAGTQVIIWNDGIQWRQYEDPSAFPRAVWGSEPDDVYVTGLFGLMMHWNGSQWDSVSVPYNNYNDIWGLNENLMYVVGVNGAAIKYTGDAWQQELIGTDMDLISVIGFESHDIYILGVDASAHQTAVFHWDGDGWDQMSVLENVVGRVLWGLDSEHLYVVAQDSVFRWQGSVWEDFFPETNPNAAIWGRNPEDLYMCGGERMYHWDGEQWMSIQDPSVALKRCLWGNESGRLWVAGSKGLIVEHTQDTPVPTPTATPTSLQSTPTPQTTIAKPTATPELVPGIALKMPSHFFNPGVICYLDAMMTNPENQQMQLPLFVILQIGAEYWFWPQWTNDIGSKAVDIIPGVSSLRIIESFMWPDTGQASMTGIVFIGALTNESMTEIYGGYDGIGWFEFGFGP